MDRNNDGIDDLWNLNLEEMEPITIGGESIRGGTPAYINAREIPTNPSPLFSFPNPVLQALRTTKSALRCILNTS